MMSLVAAFVMLIACENPTTSKTTEVITLEDPSPSKSVKTDEPSREAISHYCSSMSGLTPESLAGVPAKEVQLVIAGRMSDTAKSQKISDWHVFETWLRNTPPADRQALLKRQIERYGLQSACSVALD